MKCSSVCFNCSFLYFRDCGEIKSLLGSVPIRHAFGLMGTDPRMRKINDCTYGVIWMLIYLQMIDDPKDKIKFEQVYLKYRQFMLQIANNILKNEQDAEDAVHNSFLSVAKNISKISDLSSPRTRGFLAVITERKSIDILRDRKKHISEELIEDKIGIPFPDSCEHDLSWCIGQLSPRYREIILLKYSQGYSTREISEILGISFDAASKLDQRAKKRLDELCRREGIL